ncbi:cht-4 [Pristionchus pacificus]|uniref:Cht-4 n=1 Tax=Pristionchus pacificus TaxID=54126 RepID=A0A2A6CHN3_PRIPA|nr:cht-4 [Pristionchus pacificus]|eukprot:PDM77712.1 cht-4 [Pristionchus pacificus]
MILRICLLAALLQLAHSADDVVACYTEYHHPSTASIPSGLCTHYQLIGQTSVDWLGNFVPPNETVTDEFLEIRNREKDESKKPVLLLCVTGANPHWSRLVSFDNNMRKFATNAAKFLKESGLQGLDLDWEFPYWSSDGVIWDYEGFARLLEILHETFAPQGLLLTAAVSGPPTITRVSYNVAALNNFADLVFVMNYDFHVWTPSAPFVGFNAPLHAMPSERSELREMNSEASMRAYVKLGLDRKKAIFGMPVYNLAFVLANGKFHIPYAFADDITYDYTSHNLVCNLTSSKGWNRVWNKYAASSYLYHEEQKLWISEETEDSVRAKAGYAREQAFGGIMIFSLGTDDVSGDCGNEVFPLTNLAARTFRGQ